MRSLFPVNLLSSRNLLALGLLSVSLMLAACGEVASSNSASAEGHEHAADGSHHAPGEANAHMNEESFQDLVARFESPERLGWQMPQLVMDALGPLAGKRVMDLGAGSGYFSFRLVEAGASVIAADVDERFLDYIRERRDSMGMNPAQLELRKVPFDSPDLAPAEVDVFLTVNTYHHIGDRESYFRQVRNGLSLGGRAVIVDFKNGETPHGPPSTMRVPTQTIVQELESAGFQDLRVDSVSLPEQVIVTAFPQRQP